VFDLERPYRSFLVETADIIKTFSRDPQVVRNVQHGGYIARHGNDRVAREGAVVALQDSWNRFCRTLILYSASTDFRDRSNVRHQLATGRSFRDSISHLRQNKNSIANFTHGEPVWFYPAASIDAASVLNLPNYPRVSAALGTSNLSNTVGGTVLASNRPPIGDMVATRNYIAHRGPSARVRLDPVLQHYRVKSVIDLLHHPAPGGVTVFESWVSDLKIMADLASK